MGKDKTPRKLEANQARAVARYVRIPPRKARLVMDAVRGKYVSNALALLKFVPNFAAEAIADVIKSATANAQNGRPYDAETEKALPSLNTDNLKVAQCYVDEGPRIKRVQPRAQGRAYRIVKRMCHITIIVEEAAPKPRPQRRPQTGRRGRPQAPAARPAAVTSVLSGTAEAPAVVTIPTLEEIAAPVMEVSTPSEGTVVESEKIDALSATADNAEDAPAAITPAAE